MTSSLPPSLRKGDKDHTNNNQKFSSIYLQFGLCLIQKLIIAEFKKAFNEMSLKLQL